MALQTITQTITDPDDWDGSLFGTQLKLVQLTSESFFSKQTVTDLDGIKLVQLEVNQPIKVRSVPLSLRYVGTLFDDAYGGHFAGRAIEQDQLLVMPPKFDFDAAIKDSGFSCSSLFIPPDQLTDFFQTLIGEPLEPFDRLKTAFPNSGELRWIGAWSSLVEPGGLAKMDQAQLASLQDSLRNSALTLMAHALQSPTEKMPWELQGTGSTARLAKARKLVRIAEDYANSAVGHVQMIDLCRVAGVSERTLQYAFKTCLGVSPMNYLKRHRLHQVRHALRAADPSATTVSSIACQHGFFHLGEFSQAYKQQFEELPSTTLKTS